MGRARSGEVESQVCKGAASPTPQPHPSRSLESRGGKEKQKDLQKTALLVEVINTRKEKLEWLLFPQVLGLPQGRYSSCCPPPPGGAPSSVPVVGTRDASGPVHRKGRSFRRQGQDSTQRAGVNDLACSPVK